MPTLASQHVGGRRTAAGDLRFGLEADSLLDVAPFGVQMVELLGQRLRSSLILGEQQLKRAVGPVQSPGGVDARRQAEGQRQLIDMQRVNTGDTHQRTQARARRSSEGTQASAHQSTVLAKQRHDVGDGCQRDELELLEAFAVVEPSGAA